MNTFTLAPCQANPLHIHILTKRHKIGLIKRQIWLLCEHYLLHPWDSQELQLAQDIYDCVIITCSQVFKEDGTALNYLDYEEFKLGFKHYRMQTLQN